MKFIQSITLGHVIDIENREIQKLPVQVVHGISWRIPIVYQHTIPLKQHLITQDYAHHVKNMLKIQIYIYIYIVMFIFTFISTCTQWWIGKNTQGTKSNLCGLCTTNKTTEILLFQPLTQSNFSQLKSASQKMHMLTYFVFYGGFQFEESQNFVF